MVVDIGAVSTDEIDALVEAAGRRDTLAFERLYECFAPRVQQYLARHLNNRSAEAEDLTAEVFAKVYEKIAGYENRGVPFSAWLFRIARNQLIDYVRRSPRHEAVSLDTAFDLPEVGAGRAFEHQLSANQLQLAMGTLTEEQRRVLTLRFLQGMSTAQAAQAVGKSEEAAKKLQARGLAALKRSMDCPSGCWRIAPN